MNDLEFHSDHRKWYNSIGYTSFPISVLQLVHFHDTITFHSASDYLQVLQPQKVLLVNTAVKIISHIHV